MLSSVPWLVVTGYLENQPSTIAFLLSYFIVGLHIVFSDWKLKASTKFLKLHLYCSHQCGVEGSVLCAWA